MLAVLLFAPALHTLVIGGGPSPFYNQVAIESNVRYIGKLVHQGDPFRVLFADGNPKTKSVRFIADTPGPETKIGPFSVPGSKNQYREPDLPRLDGASIQDNVQKEIASFSGDQKAPTLLYFTGHGSLAKDLKVSQFDLWNGGRYAVPDLVAALKAYGKDQPVTILMVQCHSSDFGNAMYQGGDPKAGLAENRICGFFASVSARVAAGCSPAVNEAYYKDFSSYFLAALTGEDRLGRPVTGADYDHNGKVGMNEAFCWSLVNDDSIDTPVCTSDELLKNAAQMSDDEVFSTPYTDVQRWASTAQRAALEGLSQKLRLAGDSRLADAYKKYAALGNEDMNATPILGFRFVTLARSIVLGHAMARNPDAALRRRYAVLLKDEAANPLRP